MSHPSHAVPAPAPLIHLTDVDSTNAYCQRRAAELPCPAVVIADSQSAGRGRQGRQWVSPPGQNLYVSIIIPLPEDQRLLAALPMAAALAGLDALTHVGVDDVWVKWPNDLLVGDDRKIMGVLIETATGRNRQEQAIVGIGINLDMDADALAQIDRPATSVLVETGRDVERAELLQPLVQHFFQGWEQACAGGVAALHPRWRAASRLIGRQVRLELPRETVSGTVEDLAVDGALILATDDGDGRRIQAGDVHLTAH